MKKQLFLAATAAAMLFATSCQKDNINQGFSTRLEVGSTDAKTLLDGNDLSWDYGNDVVRIFDGTTYGDFTATQNTTHSDGTYADLINQSCTLAVGNDITYKAVYPAGIASSDDPNTITLPRVQQSTNGELAEYPMYAQSTTKSLQFKNLCSVLKIHLQKSNKSVSKIQIVTDKLITGTFTVDWNGGDPTITASNTSDHTSIVTLELDNTVSIDNQNGHDFYIYLPKGTYGYMQIKVYDANGLLFTKSNTDNITFNRSKYNYVAFEDEDIEFYEGTLNGRFTVQSNPHRQVVFSRSNLFQDDNTHEYKFAPLQTIKKLNGSNHRFAQSVAASSSFNITNGGGTAAASDWFCLSPDEWRCLMSTRTMTGGYEYKWALFKVQYHPISDPTSTTERGGLMIFPDDFRWPLDNSKKPVRHGSYTDVTWCGITLSPEDWTVLENAGCVFLPVTDYVDRSQNSNNTTISNNGDLTGHGYYWSNTSQKCLCFTPNSCLFPGQQDRNNRSLCGIRLVREIE